jgi:hypothetical protein
VSYRLEVRGYNIDTERRARRSGEAKGRTLLDGHVRANGFEWFVVIGQLLAEFVCATKSALAREL